jgi:hypothetical protein
LLKATDYTGLAEMLEILPEALTGRASGEVIGIESKPRDYVGLLVFVLTTLFKEVVIKGES